MASRAFLDEAFGDPVNSNEEEDDPEQRIPGIRIDDPVESKVGYKDCGNQVKKDPIQNIFLLEFKLDLFFNKVFDFGI